MEIREDRLPYRLFYLTGVLLLMAVFGNLWLNEKEAAVGEHLQRGLERKRELGALLSWMQETESASLAFALSGADGYLNQYRQSREHYFHALARLRQLATQQSALLLELGQLDVLV